MKIVKIIIMMTFSTLQFLVFTTESFKLVGYICVQKYIYAYIYTGTQTHTYTYVHVYIFIHTDIYKVWGFFWSWLMSCFVTVNDAFVCF